MEGRQFWVRKKYDLVTLSKLISHLFPVRINLSILEVVSFCFVLLYLAMLLRICVGPFSYLGVVVFHYLTRFTLVSFMTMLTFKIGVKILFILDFDRMAMVSEKWILMCMGVVTSIFTLVHIAAEAFLRNHRKLDHYARGCFNVYLGKVSLSCVVIF